jgi:hypothetical protein
LSVKNIVEQRLQLTENQKQFSFEKGNEMLKNNGFAKNRNDDGRGSSLLRSPDSDDFAAEIGVAEISLSKEQTVALAGFDFDDLDTDGTWRTIRERKTLVFQRLEKGNWVTKSTMVS